MIPMITEIYDEGVLEKKNQNSKKKKKRKKCTIYLPCSDTQL